MYPVEGFHPDRHYAQASHAEHYILIFNRELESTDTGGQTVHIDTSTRNAMQSLAAESRLSGRTRHRRLCVKSEPQPETYPQTDAKTAPESNMKSETTPALAWLQLTAIPLDSGNVAVIARDESLSSQMITSLTESRERLKDLVGLFSDVMWEIDREGRFILLSGDGFCGHATENVIGQPVTRFLQDSAVFSDTPFASLDPVQDTDVWIRHADGTHACLTISCLPLYDTNGQWCGARGVGRDVTRERAHEHALAVSRSRERIISYIVRAIRDETDPKQMLRAAADCTSRAFAATGSTIYNLQHGKPHSYTGATPPEGASEEAWRRLRGCTGGPLIFTWNDDHYLAYATSHGDRPNGLMLAWRSASGSPWDSDESGMLEALSAPIAIALHQAEEHNRLDRLSRTDELTSLMNRRAFMEDLPRSLNRLLRQGKSGALFYIDVDNFKPINDALGHSAGDTVLIAIAALLSDKTRSYDMVARLGGDEFAVWYEDMDCAVAARRAGELIQSAEQLVANLADPEFARLGAIGFSIGLAIFDPREPIPVTELIARADTAMYQAKRAGKGMLALSGIDMPAAPKLHPETESRRAHG